MTTTPDARMFHPAILRTTAALEVVGARQASQARPTFALSLLALGLAVGAIAAVVF